MIAAGLMLDDSDGLFDVGAPAVAVDVDEFLCCCSLWHSGSSVTVVAVAAAVVVTRSCLCCCHSCLSSWKKFRADLPCLSYIRRLSAVPQLLSTFGASLSGRSTK